MRYSDSSLTTYIQKVRRIPKLSREEELEIALRAKAGDQEAADRLVEANLRYVISVALKYRRYGIPVDELVSEGSIGLMTAIRKFEPERGNRFVTYAGYWIRAYVLDCVVRSASMVGGGSGPFRSKIFFRLRRERAQLTQLNLEPSEVTHLLSKRFGTTEEKMRGLLARLDGKDVSLQQPAFRDSATTLEETLEAPATNQEIGYIHAERQHDLQKRLRAAMVDLDDRERLIVEQRILSHDGASLASLGRSLGVSRERARQLEARAKGKLKKHFEEFAHDFAA